MPAARRSPGTSAALSASLKDLRRIPGVGPSIAQNMVDMGIRSVAELACADPNDLYERLCILENSRVDRCALYVFRCAVYFASHSHHEPDKLNWWNWKDQRQPG